MNKKIKLLWYIYPSYLLIVIVALMTMSIYSSSFLKSFFLENTQSDLLIRTHIIERQVIHLFEVNEFEKIQDLCVEAGTDSGTRITVIMPDGKVIGDSQELPENMNNHKNRPEVLTAMEGTPGTYTRVSETLGVEMLYASLPLIVDEKPRAVLRMAIPVTGIDMTSGRIQLRLILAGILVALAAAVIGFVVSRRITRPIEELKQGAEYFADGHFDHRLYSPPIHELARLSDAMNRMAYQLTERILTEESRTNEYRAVLSSMTEGIVGIDLNENIININQAARSILEVEQEGVIGMGIQEMIRDRRFISFVKSAAEREETVEDDFSLNTEGTTVINVKSTPLKSSGGVRIGTLIALSDVTHMRMLENVRKDFVANVSHEIKTPLTAIKGFIETIVRMENENPDDARRFLSIVMKHVDRLDAILEDLLTLARIEQNDPNPENSSSPILLKEIFETVLQVLQAKADEKKIRLLASVTNHEYIEGDRHLIEQALLNLVDNAIKYSGENTEVLLSAKRVENRLTVSVVDQGRGIPEKYLSRIFERFYRVDKARSRKLGGTGLGLAIVKHIAHAHGGDVSVESVRDKGSVFSIHLPIHDPV